MKNCVVRRTERVRLTRQLSNGGSVVCGVCAGQNGRIRYWRYHRRKIMIQQERGKFMGGLLGAYNAISDYLHTLNMGSTLFRLILAMFLGCLIGIDRGMKKRVAGVKTHMIVCMGATLVMMTGDFIHVYSNGGRDRRYCTTWRAGCQRDWFSWRRNDYRDRAETCFRSHDGGQSLDIRMYRTGCGDRLLQRCDLYHAGTYSGVQICEIYRGLCGRAFQYL